MDYLKDKIRKDAIVRSDRILDVKGFLNEKVDPILMNEIGKDFASHYKDYDVDAIVTVETSGIAPAIFASYFLDKPLIILKKEDHVKENYDQVQCYSFTKEKEYYLSVTKKRIENLRVVLIDDFLAAGNVVLNVKKLLEQNNSEMVAVGICISKNFQGGYQKLSDLGVDLYCQVEVEGLDPVNNKADF